MAKNFKRLFALILAVSMVMNLSVSILAADGTDTVCDKVEHLHSADCYQQTTVCDESPILICENSEEGHQHTDACFTSHAHGDDCYVTELTCQTQVHLHDESCYPVEVEIIYTDPAAASPEAVVRDEEFKTITLTDAALEEGITVEDGWTVIVDGDCSIDAGSGNAITCDGALAIEGSGELTLKGNNGIMAASVSIEDIDVAFTGTSCGIQVYNAAGAATVELTNVDGSITGGYAGVYVNGECTETEASVVVDGCKLDVTSTATSWNNRARKAGITVYVSVAKRVESSISIIDSVVNATGFDAGLSINNYLNDTDATNSASSRIDITDSIVVANSTGGTWAGIFASVLGQHEDADSVITITDSTVYAVSPNTGILTSSQKG